MCDHEREIEALHDSLARLSRALVDHAHALREAQHTIGALEIANGRQAAMLADVRRWADHAAMVDVNRGEERGPEKLTGALGAVKWLCTKHHRALRDLAEAQNAVRQLQAERQPPPPTRPRAYGPLAPLTPATLERMHAVMQLQNSGVLRPCACRTPAHYGTLPDPSCPTCKGHGYVHRVLGTWPLDP